MANRGMPSLLALLGLLAVAGYQNRDKLSGVLNDAAKRLDENQPAEGNPIQSGVGNVLTGLGDLLGGKGTESLSQGLGDLMDRFRQSGSAETADSWVTPGVPTQGLNRQQVEQAVGAENLDELAQRMGMDRDELIDRLVTNIPEGIDRMTPGGRMPTDDEARRYMGA